MYNCAPAAVEIDGLVRRRFVDGEGFVKDAERLMSWKKGRVEYL